MLWLVGALLLIAGHAALAQDQPLPEAGKVEERLKPTEPEAEQRSQLPKTAAEALRDRQKGLLDILTAENGTNPTAIVGRFQLSNSYVNSRGGAQSDDTVLRVDIPLTPSWVFRADVPVSWEDPHEPGVSSAFGLSDLFLRTGWRVYESPAFSLFVGADAIFPTATQTQLGRGKYEVGPGIVASIAIPSLQSTLIPLLQHFTSVGGDPSRRDVDASILQLELNTLWSKEWWTLFRGNLTIDWTRGAKTGAALEGEVGRRFGTHWRAWVRPGVGLWGQDVRGSYDWSAQVGIRYMLYVY